jgi:hypothetical protein
MRTIVADMDGTPTASACGSGALQRARVSSAPSFHRCCASVTQLLLVRPPPPGACTGDYSELEARQAFSRMLQTHGWTHWKH